MPQTPPSATEISQLLPREPSSWTPKQGQFPALEYCIDTCLDQISKLKPKPLKRLNLTLPERKALSDLKQRTDIVIKPADKGGAIVVWRKGLYHQEALRQLSDTSFYSPIPSTTTKADNTLVRRTVKAAISEGHLPSEASSLVVSEPREPKFYLLPKIHKVNNPGRPIVSACSCPTALISGFLDSVFQPLVAALPTYIKATNHALELFDQFTFPSLSPHRFLFTMNITSLYTNIPHNEGLVALKHFLQKSTLDINIPTTLRLAELVLNLNSFTFADKHYHQNNGVAMGTKMGPGYACLFVGFIEEQIFTK